MHAKQGNGIKIAARQTLSLGFLEMHGNWNSSVSGCREGLALRVGVTRSTKTILCSIIGVN